MSSDQGDNFSWLPVVGAPGGWGKGAVWAGAFLAVGASRGLSRQLFVCGLESGAGGAFLAPISAVLRWWGERDVHQHSCLVLVAVCCYSSVRDGGGFCRALRFCVPGDGPNFLAFHPVGLLPEFSSCFLYGPLKGPLRHPNLLFACRALLSLLVAWPSSPLLDRMSSFHHRFDLAQMMIARTCLLKISARVAWTHSISLSRSPAVHLAARVGRAPDLAHQIFASVGSDQSSSFSLPSLSFKHLPGRGDCGGFPRARSRPLPFYHFVVRCRGLPLLVCNLSLHVVNSGAWSGYCDVDNAV